MYTLHTEEVPAVGAKKIDDLRALELRVERERRGRHAAETLLESKSRELYDANRTLRHAAALLEGQRLQLYTILDHVQAAIFLVGESGAIKQINRSATRMFGLDGQTLVDVNVQDLFAQGSVEMSQIDYLLSSGNDLNDEMREATGRRSDGSEFPVEFSVAHLQHDGRGNTVWLFRDNTARKQAEAKRIALEQQLSQAHKMEALGTLASGVAHEINTPVQYVSDNIRFLQTTFADLLELIALYRTGTAELATNETAIAALAPANVKETQVDLDFVAEETPNAMVQSLQGLSQVAAIVNAIKEFSHPGGDEKEAADINHLVENTLTVTRNQWKYVAEAELELAADLPPIPCLTSDISQVLLNLIVNAADAIESSGRKPGLIKICTTALKDCVEISIADNGSGIPDDVAGRIFDPFFTTKDVGKGSGQGLAISYTIICRKHGGSIDVDTKQGVGTTFRVRLPYVASSKEGQQGSL